MNTQHDSREITLQDLETLIKEGFVQQRQYLEEYVEQKFDTFAIMVARGFERVDVRLQDTGRRFASIHKRLDRIESTIEDFRCETIENFRTINEHLPLIKLKLQ